MMYVDGVCILIAALELGWGWGGVFQLKSMPAEERQERKGETGNSKLL